MNEKYRKYIKNIPFIELFYNFNFVRQQNKELYEKVKPIMASVDETKKKKIKRNILLFEIFVIWGGNVIMPIFMFFSGFFGYFILHSLEIYLLLFSLVLSYYSLSVFKDSLDEKTKEFDKEFTRNATMTIWNYAYLSIGILLAMLI